MPSTPFRPALSRPVHVTVWMAQWFVALSFCAAAAMKLTMAIPDLAAMWPWAGELPPLAVRTLGLVDLAGGLGILLPTLTRIRPRLTVWAAAGCIALQLSAGLFHIRRGEYGGLWVNALLLVLSAAVLWGRSRQPGPRRQPSSPT